MVNNFNLIDNVLKIRQSVVTPKLGKVYTNAWKICTIDFMSTVFENNCNINKNFQQ